MRVAAPPATDRRSSRDPQSMAGNELSLLLTAQSGDGWPLLLTDRGRVRSPSLRVRRPARLSAL